MYMTYSNLKGFKMHGPVYNLVQLKGSMGGNVHVRDIIQQWRLSSGGRGWWGEGVGVGGVVGLKNIPHYTINPHKNYLQTPFW